MAASAKFGVFNEFRDKGTIAFAIADCANTAVVPNCLAGASDLFDVRVKIAVLIETTQLNARGTGVLAAVIGISIYIRAWGIRY
ncbi:hypothetical protein [Bdellovibrio sp. HCB337]|uniref:hypothetical protein n=1 Tax=Bdellovibrio sp. HCB337 TaxID=3394358 RepID=UPI0039A44136